MNRRLAIQILAAPVVAGFTTKIAAAGENNNPNRILLALAEEMQTHIRCMDVPVGLRLMNIEDYLVQRCTDAGLTRVTSTLNPGTAGTAGGRFQLVRAVDPDTFLPKVGVFMYPSQTEYKDGVKFVVSLREDKS